VDESIPHLARLATICGQGGTLYYRAVRPSQTDWPETARLSHSALGKWPVEGSDAPLALLVSHPHGAGLVPLRPGEPLVIGRAPPAHIVIEDTGLSRQHARFTVLDQKVVVEDLGSLNGTRMGSERITRAELAPGGVVQLGRVFASVQALSQRTESSGRVEGHAQLIAALEQELQRSSFFGRGLALVMLKAGDSSLAVHELLDRVRTRLRPVDRLATYSIDTLEILMPEASPDDVKQALARFNQAGVRATAGAVIASTGGVSSERLIAECRAALHRAGREPVVVSLDREPARLTQRDIPIIAESPAMQAVLKTATRLARGVIPVLLIGETGVGKEVLARYLHESGPRREKPLICVNCASIPPPLLESSLFGHEKGAFTGAIGTREGVFEAAEGGTLLLDEVGELTASAQAALLRVLENKRVMRVGSTKEIPIDVRIIAATHRDLELMSERGEFRQDLLYRLNALALAIPPLRERREDIPVLARKFLADANLANASSVRDIEEDALELLVEHAWPGNVRELRNVIERATVVSETGTITPADLPAHIGSTVEPASDSEVDFRTRMERLEVEVIVAALEKCGWNQTQAARKLEMPLRTLQYKLKTLNIERPRKK
jgi:DNA-binding NtrC family response regulator